MLLIYCVFLTHLLLNNCLGEITSNGSNESNIKSASSAISGLPLENLNANSKTTFVDLNEDVLYLILDLLDISELTNVGVINPKMAYIANDVFRLKFQQYRYEIVRAYYSSECEEKFTMYNSIQMIQLRSYELALNILQCFGHQIQALTFYYKPDTEERFKKLNQFANKYALESLTRLDLHCVTDNLLNGFTVPFKNVETIHGYFMNNVTGATVVPFNETFPKLKHLRALELRIHYDYNFINRKFAHLEILEITLSAGWKWQLSNTMKQIESLLEQNPQIRSLILSNLPSDFIKVIGKHFDHLDTLSIDKFDLKGQRVHVNSVKNFQLLVSEPRSIENLTFSHLETMQMAYYSSYFDRWTEFFRNNQNLSKLIMRAIEGQHLIPLMAELPNLHELKWSCRIDVGIDVINSIIQTHDKLMKIELLFEFSYEQLKVDSFQQNIQNGWNVSEFVPRGGFLIERTHLE